MEFLVGKWTSPTKTWFDPSAEAIPGSVTTEFVSILDGMFIEENYQGTVGDKAHVGKRIFGFDERLEEATCYWIDSFHTGTTAMECRGKGSDEHLSFTGYYYGDNEKWGWRIEFTRLSSSQIAMKHFNITPTGESALAVEALLTKA